MNYPIFNSIQTFINELGDCYSTDNKSLALYKHLLSKTTINHVNAVNKHIKLFKDYCIVNRVAIETNNVDAFKVPEVKYSDRVFINIQEILKDADEESSTVIWKHLMVLSAYLDKDSISKDLLMSRVRKEEEESSAAGTKGKEFITSMVEDISKKINIPADAENVDVGKVMQDMMASGALTDIFTTVQTSMSNGDIDIPSLLTNAQEMMSGMNDGEGAPDMMGMMSKMMSGMGSAEGSAEGAPDMMGMMAKMMSGMNSGGTEGAPDMMGMVNQMMSGMNGGPPPS